MRSTRILGVLLMALVLGTSGIAKPRPPVNQGAELEATVCVQVDERLVLSILDREDIFLAVNAVLQPTDEASSFIEVMTNASSYTISAIFGSFEVDETGYDLIENENFKIMSEAPGTGEAIYTWISPDGVMEIVAGEDGLTNGETTVVSYQLSADFTVPTGLASTIIVYSAAMSL